MVLRELLPCRKVVENARHISLEIQPLDFRSTGCIASPACNTSGAAEVQLGAGFRDYRHMWFLVASCHGRCGHDDAPWSAAFPDYLLGEVVCIIILLQHPSIHAACGRGPHHRHVGVVHIIMTIYCHVQVMCYLVDPPAP